MSLYIYCFLIAYWRGSQAPVSLDLEEPPNSALVLTTIGYILYLPTLVNYLDIVPNQS